MPNVHSFHVVMSDGEERDIKAGEATVNPTGTLVFLREDSGDVKVAIAPGAWRYFEVEAQDDRG